jgi:hypothetical protein
MIGSVSDASGQVTTQRDPIAYGRPDRDERLPRTAKDSVLGVETLNRDGTTALRPTRRHARPNYRSGLLVKTANTERIQ